MSQSPQKVSEKDCCSTYAAITNPAEQAALTQQVETLSAVADETRLKILKMLANHSSLCVCDFTSVFPLGQSTVSHHLRILREANLLQAEKQGVWTYYSLNREQFKKVLVDLLAFV